jgi:hypothetical protein
MPGGAAIVGTYRSHMQSLCLEVDPTVKQDRVAGRAPTHCDRPPKLRSRPSPPRLTPAPTTPVVPALTSQSLRSTP